MVNSENFLYLELLIEDNEDRDTSDYDIRANTFSGFGLVKVTHAHSTYSEADIDENGYFQQITLKNRRVSEHSASKTAILKYEVSVVTGQEDPQEKDKYFTSITIEGGDFDFDNFESNTVFAITYDSELT